MILGANTLAAVELSGVRIFRVPAPPIPPTPTQVVQGAGVPKNYVWKTKIKRVVIGPDGRRTTPAAELDRIRPLIEAHPRGTLHKALGVDEKLPLSYHTLQHASLWQGEVGERAKQVHYLKRLVNPLYR